MLKGFVFSLKMNGVDISIDHLQQVPAHIIIKHIFQCMVAWPHLPGFQRREPCHFPVSHHTCVVTGVCSHLALKVAIKSRRAKALEVSKQPSVIIKGLHCSQPFLGSLLAQTPTIHFVLQVMIFMLIPTIEAYLLYCILCVSRQQRWPGMTMGLKGCVTKVADHGPFSLLRALHHTNQLQKQIVSQASCDMYP